ncbi:hypothetical protein EJB05_55589 [Eragrostis curvula]|uniref:Uncharacterized protein n=1 Tax=Eragrostis curvula TaxID=38414 RepID=A0A5J9SJA7_9POAL|nr:hypothetical protein EJB05_55589 [Eragrostis curvula]
MGASVNSHGQCQLTSSKVQIFHLHARETAAEMPSLRQILLVAAVALWSAASVAAADTFLPPGTASPFPFCPTRPAGVPTMPFPWSPPPPMTIYPQDPGFFSSGVYRVSRGAPWLPLAAVLSAFFILL